MTAVHHTRLGTVVIEDDGEALTRLHLAPEDHAPAHPAPLGVAARAAEQLDEYLAGARTSFDLPLAPRGTAFEEAVWGALLTIPYGQTRSYGEIAAQIGRSDPARPWEAARAVGRANGRNPLWVVVPCHRVIGANGALTGYAGGLEVKRALLELESGAARLL